MTENADVQWLRQNARKVGGFNWGVVYEVDADRLRRLLAHIDQLEADLRESRNEWESASERVASLIDMLNENRPTIHEIAAQMMAAMIGHDLVTTSKNLRAYAEIAYDAAEALVAEGRRRDGL